MIPKLRTFYEDFMIPEIVDSRRMRNMPLRDGKRTKKPSVAEVAASRNSHEQTETLDDNENNQELENFGENHHSQVHCENRNDGDLESSQHFPEFDDSINQEENRSIVEGLIAYELSDREINILQGRAELESDHFDILWRIIGEVTEGLYAFRPLLLLQHSLDLIEPIHPLQKHIQILNRGGNHWVCAYYDTERIFIYDSLLSKAQDRTAPYKAVLRQLFPKYKTAAFAVSLVYSLDPSQIRYDQGTLRQHYLRICQTGELRHFRFCAVILLFLTFKIR
ncbi:uncharacterized protein LOC107045285 [Diachasma alloeum]|uniref:uncharacterized protein LOC107045285 n=1 Tax=Diachasma alloeum TaxID=454923 RepID=UPI00073821BD|nr:uncharacterized protein LOC107045285 [Diachasma alloeum]